MFNISQRASSKHGRPLKEGLSPEEKYRMPCACEKYISRKDMIKMAKAQHIEPFNRLPDNINT